MSKSESNPTSIHKTTDSGSRTAGQTQSKRKCARSHRASSSCVVDGDE